MFELPDAKRIKRSDLDSRDQSSNDGAETDLNSHSAGDRSSGGGTAHENPSCGFEYDFVAPVELQHTVPATQSEDFPSYEFRLFSDAAYPTTEAIVDTTEKKTCQLITLTRSPSPSSTLPQQEGRFLRSRHTSYYFTSANYAIKTQHATTAVSSAEILSLSSTAWPGTALPWRTVSIPASQLHKSLRQHLLASPSVTAGLRHAAASSLSSVSTTTTTASTARIKSPTRRPKPNKTRRLALRRRLAARRQSNPDHAQSSLSKPNLKPITKKLNAKGELELDLPPEEREKRTARNREKKVKRRQRERERKVAAAATATGTIMAEEGIAGSVSD